MVREHITFAEARKKVGPVFKQTTPTYAHVLRKKQVSSAATQTTIRDTDTSKAESAPALSIETMETSSTNNKRSLSSDSLEHPESKIQVRSSVITSDVSTESLEVSSLLNGPVEGPSQVGSNTDPSSTPVGPVEGPSSPSEGPVDGPSPPSEGPVGGPSSPSEGPVGGPSPTPKEPVKGPSPTPKEPVKGPSPVHVESLKVTNEDLSDSSKALLLGSNSSTPVKDKPRTTVAQPRSASPNTPAKKVIVKADIHAEPRRQTPQTKGTKVVRHTLIRGSANKK